MTEEPAAPLDRLEALAGQEQEIDDDLAQIEISTMSGLLSLWWHGRRDAERVVVHPLIGPGRWRYEHPGARPRGHASARRYQLTWETLVSSNGAPSQSALRRSRVRPLRLASASSSSGER